MQFNCNIQMDNDAFVGTEPLTHPLLEVSRILNKLSKNLHDAYVDGETYFDGYLRDINGNKVGYYRVEKTDAD